MDTNSDDYSENIQRILAEKQRQSNELEFKMQNLKICSEELDKKEPLTELEREELDEEKKKIDAMNRSLQLASEEQKRSNDSILRLVEKHKRKKEETLNKILQLEKELDYKQKLQMEIQKLKGKLQVMKHLNEINEEFEDKCSELQDLEDTNSALMIKERQSNDELLEARQELIMGVRGLLTDRTNLRVKRMGELDAIPFMKACKQRYSGEEVEVQYAMLCSKWQENLKDPAWHPFKRVETENNMKEVVDEEDEKLKNLRDEWGEEVKNAVKTALETLWNSKQGRKATLKEVIVYMTQQIKILKSRKRKRY